MDVNATGALAALGSNNGFSTPIAQRTSPNPTPGLVPPADNPLAKQDTNTTVNKSAKAVTNAIAPVSNSATISIHELAATLRAKMTNATAPATFTLTYRWPNGERVSRQEIVTLANVPNPPHEPDIMVSQPGFNAIPLQFDHTWGILLPRYQHAPATAGAVPKAVTINRTPSPSTQMIGTAQGPAPHTSTSRMATSPIQSPDSSPKSGDKEQDGYVQRDHKHRLDSPASLLQPPSDDTSPETGSTPE